VIEANKFTSDFCSVVGRYAFKAYDHRNYLFLWKPSPILKIDIVRIILLKIDKLKKFSLI